MRCEVPGCGVTVPVHVPESGCALRCCMLALPLCPLPKRRAPGFGRAKQGSKGSLLETLTRAGRRPTHAHTACDATRTGAHHHRGRRCLRACHRVGRRFGGEVSRVVNLDTGPRALACDARGKAEGRGRAFAMGRGPASTVSTRSLATIVCPAPDIIPAN